MKEVYIIYTRLGYDGIVVEGVADNLECAVDIATKADPNKRYELSIDVLKINEMINSKTVMTIEKGKVTYASKDASSKEPAKRHTQEDSE